MAGVLQELREARGFSLRAVAEAAGCSHESVRRLEQHGLTEHTDRAIAARVAGVYGLTLEEAFPSTSIARERSPRPGVVPLGPWVEPLEPVA